MKVKDRRINRRAPVRSRFAEEEPERTSAGQVLSFVLAGMALVAAVAFAGHEFGQNAIARSLPDRDLRAVVSPASTILAKGSLLVDPTVDTAAPPVMRASFAPMATDSLKADLVQSDDVITEAPRRSSAIDNLIVSPPVWKIEKAWKLGQERRNAALAKRQRRLAQRDCLARAVYFEARSETELGQLAVARVIINRAKNPQYPSTICDVVYQGSQRKNSCQFSFACDGASDQPRNGSAWRQAQRIADEAREGSARVKGIQATTHYHADYVTPRWANSLHRLIKIGRHIFYSDS